MRVVTADEFRRASAKSVALPIEAVRPLLEEVKEHGDEGVRRLTRRFDGVELQSLRVEREEIAAAYRSVEPELVAAITRSVERLRSFCARQLAAYQDFDMEIEPGCFIGQRVVPIARVGVYVPGGRFPLISSVYMGVVPARVAGVEQVVVCSPPTWQGSVHPAILAAADIAGADEVYRIGGVQAIGAMAFGTETIRRVDKIVGPGNTFVTAAKKEVYGQVGIDFVAGPSEVLVIADESASPELLAADLLAQAEHDPDACPLLVTTSATLANRVHDEVERQLQSLPTADTARLALERNGAMILVGSVEEAILVANERAPEHLELQVCDPAPYLAGLRNYGSLFVGGGAAEALGDYSSGLNHVLPTNGAARYTGGLSVRDFLKVQTVLRVQGKVATAPLEDGIRLAEAEGLAGHARSLRMRQRR